MGKAVQPKTILVYQDKNGKEPFTVWFRSLKDTKGRARIEARLRRLETGNYGDCEPVGEGVYELRLFFGPGYRVYFGEEGESIVLLLNAGSKASQNNDIETAKEYWREHKSHA
jgi:putative addiction module killer protein